MPGLMALVDRAPCFKVRMGKALVDDPSATVRRLAEDGVFAGIGRSDGRYRLDPG